MNRFYRRATVTLLLVVFSLLSIVPLEAQRRTAASAQTSVATRPKLVVGIVIDQFRYDYLIRFSDLFGAGGFKRLTSQGAFFENANYIHVPTVTALGHSTFMTGSIPALDGIVGNA